MVKKRFFISKINLLVVVVNFLTLNILAQDSLALMSGKTYLGELSYEDEQYLYFNKKVDDDKIKLMRYPLRLVFSLTDKNNSSKVYYKQDSHRNNFLSQNQMKMYVLGEQDAVSQFKRGPYFLLGLGFGFAVSLMDTYEFKDVSCKGYFSDSPSIISIATPFVSSIVIGFPNKKVRKTYVSNHDYLQSKSYKRGFNYVKNYRKTTSAFLGGLTGVFSVLVVTFVHNKNNACP